MDSAALLTVLGQVQEHRSDTLSRLDGLIDLITAALQEAPPEAEPEPAAPTVWSASVSGRYYLVLRAPPGREQLCGLHSTKASYAKAVAQEDSLPYTSGPIQFDRRTRPGDSFVVNTVAEARVAWTRISSQPMPRH